MGVKRGVYHIQATPPNTFPQNITINIKNVYEKDELCRDSTCKEYLQVAHVGKTVRRALKHYNLVMIISINNLFCIFHSAPEILTLFYIPRQGPVTGNAFHR